MLLSTQTQRFAGHFGDVRAVEMLAEIGFDALDYSMFRMSDTSCILNSDAYKEHILGVRKAADKAGIVFNQAHAPYTFNWSDQSEYDSIIFPRTLRSLEIASLLGAQIIVVHPVHHFVYKGHEKEIKEVNMTFYRSLLPYAEKYNLKIALENMFQFDEMRKCIVADTCSSAQEFVDYLDTLCDEHFVGCLDVGHAVLAGEDDAELIRALGPERLQCLHIHDNNFYRRLGTCSRMQERSTGT